MVLALIYQVNRDPKRGRSMRPEDFHPYMSKRLRGAPLNAANFQALRKMARVERTVRAQDVVVR